MFSIQVFVMLSKTANSDLGCSRNLEFGTTLSHYLKEVLVIRSFLAKEGAPFVCKKVIKYRRH